MKKIFTILVAITVIFSLILLGSKDMEICTSELNCQPQDMLRIHIRANSNSEEDQSLKYQIKDLLLEYVSEDILKLTTKGEIEEYFISNKSNIEYVVDNFIEYNGYNYKAELTIDEEFFPTRIYGNNVVSSGYYDAIILNLGDAKGENWWCIAYPTLCFEDYQKLNGNVVYKSRILDIIKIITGDKEK